MYKSPESRIKMCYGHTIKLAKKKKKKSLEAKQCAGEISSPERGPDHELGLYFTYKGVFT